MPRFSKSVTIGAQGITSKKEIKDVMRRYTEKTKCCEFLIKFSVNSENAENSSISNILKTAEEKAGVMPPVEVLEHKDKKNILRQETKYFENSSPFNQEIPDTKLIGYLLELLANSNGLLNLVSADKSHTSEKDELRILEMSLNKEEVLCKFIADSFLIV